MLPNYCFYTCKGPKILMCRIISLSEQCFLLLITTCTPGHLQILWDVFANKSADTMSFHNSFITISNGNHRVVNNLDFKAEMSKLQRVVLVYNSLLESKWDGNVDLLLRFQPITQKLCYFNKWAYLGLVEIVVCSELAFWPMLTAQCICFQLTAWSFP